MVKVLQKATCPRGIWLSVKMLKPLHRRFPNMKPLPVNGVCAPYRMITVWSCLFCIQAAHRVELLGFTDEWWHVRVGDRTGYIRHNPAAFKQISGYYYDGYRIGIVNNANPSDRLNLRKQPKTSAASLGKYYNGCVVALLSAQNNGWIHVRIGSLEGYMEARYLLLNAKINSVASAMPTLTIRNSSGTGLNLRENPVKSSETLGLYSNGTSVQVLGLSENWYHVQVDGKIGFMISSGFSDRLSYSSSNTSSSSKDDTAWNGADWET